LVGTQAGLLQDEAIDGSIQRRIDQTELIVFLDIAAKRPAGFFPQIADYGCRIG